VDKWTLGGSRATRMGRPLGSCLADGVRDTS
jgi:hypothetical protein